MESFDQILRSSRLIAILRGITPETILPVCDTLWQHGITLLEIPLNSPNAVESIALAADHCRDRQFVGAGTVLTVQNVRDVAAAGGTFIISPNTDPEVIRETKRLGLLSIPGFLTPTEAFTALRAGADYLKLFPAGNFGIRYVKDLKAVIPVPILAVGGVDQSNLADFLTVCAGAGIGSALYKAGDSPSVVSEKAAKLIGALSLK